MKKIFTTLTIILILSNLSCNSIDNSNKITEDQVKQTVSNFFASIEIGSELNTTDYITDDFKIVELGGPYTLDEFWALIAESQGENIAISRKWDLSNWSISIDINSAHVSYKNNGTFVTSIEGQEVTTNPVWLESGYLVLNDGKLKIKYFQSEEVSDYLSK
tara:strand:- start:34 stop:516 length:483 start_codon:yes stop_codon:yes gene_type:complete